MAEMAYKAADKRPPLKEVKEKQRLWDCQRLKHTSFGLLKSWPRQAQPGREVIWKWWQPTSSSANMDLELLSDFAKAEEADSNLPFASEPGLDTVSREFCPIFGFNWLISLLLGLLGIVFIFKLISSNGWDPVAALMNPSSGDYWY